MMETVKSGRKVMAQGMEHIVMFPQKTDRYVIKIPRKLNRISFWPRNPVESLRKELSEAQQLVEGTRVKIPRTHIHGRKFNWPNHPFPGYIIRQENILEDQSIPDIGEFLEQENLDSLVQEYRHEPRNFISHCDYVYWIDPTKGLMGRVFERTKVMDIERWRNIRMRLHKPIRKLGL